MYDSFCLQLKILNTPSHSQHSHPKYRAALHKKMPCLFCDDDRYSGDNVSQASAMTTISQPEKKPEAWLWLIWTYHK